MTNIDNLLVDRGPGQTRVAVLSGDRVVEVYYHRLGVPSAGAVYRGRVGKALTGSNSMFVEIGLDQPALMATGSKSCNEGDVVDVRIVQPPRGEKGAKVALADAKLIETSVDESVTSAKPPVCLLEAEHPIALCARLYANSLSAVLVTPSDADGVVAALLAGDKSNLVSTQAGDIFSDFGVDEVIERALEREVPLAGGGKLIIEPTAALTSIDVDAGPMQVGEANKVAIDTLARELRLRAIAGPIIVDLIPMKGRSGLVARCKEAVADDPVPTQVSGLTPEGRLEINRRRSRPSLADLLLDDPVARPPSCQAVALDALRQSVRAGLKTGSVRVTLKAHDKVIAALQGPLRPALNEAEDALKAPLMLQVAPDVSISFAEISTA